MKPDRADTAATATAAKAPRRSQAARLFGYDLFISFALGQLPRGTQSYASDLARRLRERDFTVFFSEDEAPPGAPLTSTLRAALHRSQVLVVVANRGTLASPRWVREEVAEFRASNPQRPVIPISVGGALQDPALAADTQAWLAHEEKIWLDETEEAVETGIASEALVERLALAPTRVRSNVGWRWIVRSVIAGLAVLTAVSVAAAIYAARQRDEANRQNAIAQAGRLAAQADLLRERGGAVDTSVLLAAQALRILSSIGERSLEVDLSLRRALALLPRVQGEFDRSAAQSLRMSPSGEHVIAEGTAGQSAVWAVRDGVLRSCSSEDVKAPQSEYAIPRVRLVTAASTDGGWCVVQEFDDPKRATLEVWSAHPLQRLERLTIGSKAGHVIPAISDDGALIATTDRAQMGEPEKSTFRLWSRARQSEILRGEGEEFLGFSPDSRHVATTKALWRVPADARAAPLQVLAWNAPPWRLAFSRDGAHVATRSAYDGDVELWDVNAARELRTSQPPNGHLLALSDAAAFIIVGSNQDALLWDTENELTRARVPLEAEAAAFSSTGPLLLSSDTVQIRLSRLRVLSMPAAGAALASTELAARDKALWLGLRGDEIDLLVSADDAIRLETWAWRNGTRTIAATLPPSRHWAVSADGRRVAVARDGQLTVLPIGAGGPAVEIEHSAAPEALALSSDASYVAVAGADRMQVWKLGSTERWTSPPLPDTPSIVKVSRDGSFALAVLVGSDATRAGARHTLVRWRLANPGEMLSIDLGRYPRPLSSACFISDDGRFVRAAGQRREIAANSGPLRIDPYEQSECDDAARPLQLAAEVTHLIVTDRRHGRALARLDHPAKILLSAASATGQHVATVDEGRSVQVFALNPEELIAQACGRDPRALAADERKQYLGAASAQDACGRALGSASAP